MRLRIPALAFAFALVSLSLVADASDVVPMMIPHVGRLLDGDDHPATGQHTLTFAIYPSFVADPTNPTPPVWTDTYSVNLGADGVYSVTLGDTTQGQAHTPMVLDGAGTNLFLGIAVDGGTELTPRLRLGSSPFAFVAARAQNASALTCQGCLDGTQLGAGAVTNDKIADATIEVGKLKNVNGKVVGLDADTLDGLDSSAFAPADIENDVAAIKTSVGSNLGDEITTISGQIATANTNLGALQSALSTTDTNLAALQTTASATNTAIAATQTTLSSTGTNVSAIQTALADGSTGLAALGSKVDGLKTSAAQTDDDVKASTTTLDKVLQRQAYSQDCKDGWVQSAWGDSNDATGYQNCLRDGRWHMLGSIPPFGQPSINGFTTVDVISAAQSGANFKVMNAAGSFVEATGISTPGNDTHYVRFELRTMIGNRDSDANFLHWQYDGSKTAELYMAKDTNFDYSGPASTGGWGFHTGWSRAWTGATNISDKFSVWAKW